MGKISRMNRERNVAAIPVADFRSPVTLDEAALAPQLAIAIVENPPR
jgi:hypothetical protein